MLSKLNIIGGNWRSRKLNFEEVQGLRPTPARVRETLFNWLQYDIIGSRCLDLYAGSGALGFEAASRGAASVVQVEYHPVACRHLHNNAQTLNAPQISIVQQDVLQFLEQTQQTFDLVFLDPPFHLDLAINTCLALEQSGCLATSAKIYVETESKDQNKRPYQLTGIPDNWHILKQKTAGEVMYSLYEIGAN